MKIALEVNGKRYTNWVSVDINLKLNSIASEFDLTAWKDELSKDLFFPFSFAECKVYIFSETTGFEDLLITGYVVNPAMSIQKEPKLSRIKGFSKPGILAQTAMPKALYPLEYNDYSLKDIASRICKHFNLDLYVHPGAVDKSSEKIKKIECSEGQNITSFLSSIALTKQITVCHDNLGRLMLLRIVDITKATSSVSETDNHISMSLSPNGQGMHSEIVCYKEKDSDTYSGEGTDYDKSSKSKVTIRSPFFKGVKIKTNGKSKTVDLTAVYKLNDAYAKDLDDYASYMACQEARNFPVMVERFGWTFDDISKQGVQRVVRSGFYLMLKAPSIFITENTKMIVEDMRFTKDAKGPEMLKLTCLLPCVYTGRLPKQSPFKR